MSKMRNKIKITLFYGEDSSAMIESTLIFLLHFSLDLTSYCVIHTLTSMHEQQTGDAKIFSFETKPNRGRRRELTHFFLICYFILLTARRVTASFSPMTFALFANHGQFTACIRCRCLVGFNLQQVHLLALVLCRWWLRINDGDVGHRCTHGRRYDRMIAVNNHRFVIFNGGRRVQVNTSAILQALWFLEGGFFLRTKTVSLI